MDQLVLKFLVGGDFKMRGLLEKFLSMPIIVRMVCAVMLLSPIFTLMSVLSGSVLHSDSPVYEYGAAKNLLELMLVTIATLPAFAGGILMLRRRRSSVHLFAVGYLGAAVGPFYLSAMRESIEYMISSVLGALVIGGFVYAYLCLSSEVRRYFELTP